MGPKFRRQHNVGPYTLDFYCPAAGLAVELDGGQHYDGVQHRRDEARDEWLAKQGIRVLRFSDREALLKAEVLAEVIWRAVRESGGPRGPRG
jgi:very-short-patch-repair endonuclease